MVGGLLTQQIEEALRRATVLQQCIDEAPDSKNDLVKESLDQLHSTLEELRVSEEELRIQNEQLVAARAAAETQEQRYRELFEFAPDGYLVTDSNGVIQQANRVASQLLNVEQHFLVGKPLALFIDIPMRSVFRSKLWWLQQGRPVQEWEVHLQPREQSPFEAALTVAAMPGLQSEAVVLRWLVRDISTRRQKEEQLRRIQTQNMHLLEVSRLKSQFLATMSHELRTPMNAILGFAQLLLRPKQKLAPPQQDMLERILNNGKNLLRLIDDILDISRLESGRMELRPERFNLTELVHETIDELRPLAVEQKLDLQIRADLPDPWVVNDPDRLRQVLVNLLSNAIKFTEVGEVRVAIQEPIPDFLLLEVQDTGIGIASTDIESIFQEFHQANQSFTRRYGGTGLGLAITRSLVKLMGGAITVNSEVNQGSTFRVRLPRQVKAAAQRNASLEL
ncbi:PAS domain-containing sensor histidine kinase [Leptolyngbya sp. FACHB-261]|uniref:PAS domain-containing sensor histidine kinase n=1 Tax=Leptolyngbya sp. FACHB-261 TaxID=2692806 RepID=UPI001687A46D|nr:ATP-binding protein [Leptolyngbya sp. FACHB-261]MBD2100054.1 PAS domain S-box protein [Leptolyngbya sp. FACHB-261]